MKKGIALVLALVVALLCAGCGKKTGDIPMEKLQWALNEGQLDDGTYVFVDVTNNSQYTFTAMQLNFEMPEDVDSMKVTEFYMDIQENQGFSNDFMQQYIKDMNENGKRPTMVARISQPLAPGETARQIKCYYMGGWTSRNVLYAEQFSVTSIVIEYEKDGISYTQTYDYSEGAYTCAETVVSK